MTSQTRFWPGLLGAAALMIGLSACSKTSDGGASTPATPPAPAATVTLAANPSSITLGASTTLSWSTTNAFACTASGGWSGNKATSGSEAQTPSAAGTVTYTLTCAGNGGGGNASASVTVTAQPAPTVTLSAAPTSVVIGSASTLTWSSTNATACTATDGWTGTRATSGTQAVTPASLGATGYTLTCTGPGGSAAATATVTATPPPTASLTITGRVIDAPIPNANVTITVGSQTFTGTADGNGNYSIPITIPGANIGQFVSILATGSTSQANVVFTSLLGSFSSLQTAAGSDAILTSAEAFRVNVTNFSTAEAALVSEVNGGALPTTDAQLTSALMAVDTTQETNIATVIKLVVDNGVALPAGTADTMQLAASPSARTAFILQQQNDNGTQFSSVQIAALNDPALTMGTTAANVPATVYETQFQTSPEDDLYGTSGGFTNRYDFNPDGTGRLSRSDLGSNDLRWVVDANGNIVVTFTSNPSSTTTRYYFDPAVNQQRSSACTNTLQQVTLRPVSAMSISDRSQGTLTCDVASLNSSFDGTSLETGLTPTQVAGLGTITASDVSGRVLALKVFDAGRFNDLARTLDPAEFVTFSADGTGSTRFFGLSLTWTVSNGALRVAYSNGTAATYRRLRNPFPGLSIWLSEFVSPSGVPYSDNSVVAQLDNSLVFTATNAPGDYYQYGIGASTSDYENSIYGNVAPVSYGDIALLKGFALRLNADGTSSSLFEYFDPDANGNIVRYTDTGSIRVWGTRADGSLGLQAYVSRSQQARCTPSFDSTDPNCLATDTRDVFPVAVQGNRRLVVERRRIAFTSSDIPVTQSTPADYIVRFYDIAPVGDYEQPRSTAPLRANQPAGASPRRTSSVAHTTAKATDKRNDLSPAATGKRTATQPGKYLIPR